MVHGSHSFGLAREDSDLDVLTSLSLGALVRRLGRDPGSSAFNVLESVTRAKVPRLILQHIATGMEVDVIRMAADARAPQRDEIFRKLFRHDRRARDLALLIGDWVREHAQVMPPRVGFPNSYTFRIIGFHHLMVRPGGAILPPLALEGVDCDAAAPGTPAAAGVGAEVLFREWLGCLATSDANGLWVNLRSPWESGPGWRVVDPVSGHSLTQFRGSQPSTIAHLARQSLLSTRE